MYYSDTVYYTSERLITELQKCKDSFSDVFTNTEQFQQNLRTLIEKLDNIIKAYQQNDMQSVNIYKSEIMKLKNTIDTNYCDNNKICDKARDKLDFLLDFYESIE